MTWLQHSSFGEERFVELNQQGQPLQIIIRRDLVLNMGDIVSAKITAFNSTLHGYFASTERGNLFIPTTQHLTEGQTVTVQITKEARQDKDATAQLTASPAPFTPPEANTISPSEMDGYISDAISPTISFLNGAKLHIERTRVCWTIDVDSGKSDLPLTDINQAALIEISRQMTLKNMGGLILIDFAGSKKGKTKALSHDFISDDLTTIHGWTKSGLLELERRRTRASLWDTCSDDNPIAIYYRVRRALDTHPLATPCVAPAVLKLLQQHNIKAIPLFDHPLSYFELQEK